MSSNATCTCPSLCGDLCHLGEGCRAMEKIRRLSQAPNFCSRCGKRLTPEGVHTCTPLMPGGPMERDLRSDDERSKFIAELEQARTMAATAEKWRGLVGDGRTVQEIQREAAEEEREACAKVAESFEESGMEWAWDAVPGDYIAAAIRTRGQK